MSGKHIGPPSGVSPSTPQHSDSHPCTRICFCFLLTNGINLSIRCINQLFDDLNRLLIDSFCYYCMFSGISCIFLFINGTSRLINGITRLIHASIVVVYLSHGSYYSAVARILLLVSCGTNFFGQPASQQPASQ